MKTGITALAIFLSASTMAYPFVHGGSNLPNHQYPPPDCKEPEKPHKPKSLGNQQEWDAYNRKHRAYAEELIKYGRCLGEYAKNAENDIERIRERLREP